LAVISVDSLGFFALCFFFTILLNTPSLQHNSSKPLLWGQRGFLRNKRWASLVISWPTRHQPKSNQSCFTVNDKSCMSYVRIYSL
jgi:hypothetical protein